MAAKLKVTQTKSTISHIARNRATIKALGLHGIGTTRIVADKLNQESHRCIKDRVSENHLPAKLLPLVQPQEKAENDQH